MREAQKGRCVELFAPKQGRMGGRSKNIRLGVSRRILSSYDSVQHFEANVVTLLLSNVPFDIENLV